MMSRPMWTIARLLHSPRWTFLHVTRRCEHVIYAPQRTWPGPCTSGEKIPWTSNRCSPDLARPAPLWNRSCGIASGPFPELVQSGKKHALLLRGFCGAEAARAPGRAVGEVGCGHERNLLGSNCSVPGYTTCRPRSRPVGLTDSDRGYLIGSDEVSRTPRVSPRTSPFVFSSVGGYQIMTTHAIKPKQSPKILLCLLVINFLSSRAYKKSRGYWKSINNHLIFRFKL